MKHDCNSICTEGSLTEVGKTYQYKEDDALYDVELLSEGVTKQGFVFLELKPLRELHRHFSGQPMSTFKAEYNPEYARVAYNGMWRLFDADTYQLMD